MLKRKRTILSSEKFKKQIVTKVGHDKLFSWANEKGIKRWVIETIEKGKIPEKHEHLVSIADALEVSIDWLLTGEEPRQTKQEQLPSVTEAEHEFVEDLLKILRGRNKANAEAIKSNVKAFAATSDYVPPPDEPDKKKNPTGMETSSHCGIKKKIQNK